MHIFSDNVSYLKIHKKYDKIALISSQCTNLTKYCLQKKKKNSPSSLLCVFRPSPAPDLKLANSQQMWSPLQFLDLPASALSMRGGSPLISAGVLKTCLVETGKLQKKKRAKFSFIRINTQIYIIEAGNGQIYLWSQIIYFFVFQIKNPTGHIIRKLLYNLIAKTWWLTKKVTLNKESKLNWFSPFPHTPLDTWQFSLDSAALDAISSAKERSCHGV